MLFAFRKLPSQAFGLVQEQEWVCIDITRLKEELVCPGIIPGQTVESSQIVYAGSITGVVIADGIAKELH